MIFNHGFKTILIKAASYATTTSGKAKLFLYIKKN